jgi:hypothetical protein
VAAKTPRNDTFVEEAYLGGALTPLQLLAQHRTDLAGAAAAMKDFIVAGVDNAKGKSTDKVQFANTAIQVFGGELQWTANLTGYDSTKDEVSTQWYYQGASKLGWAVLEPVSGDSPPSTNSTGGTNGYFYITRYLQAAGQCLQPGTYRVEVYVNGHLSGTADTAATLPTLTAAAMPDVGASVCHPPEWKPDVTNVLRGFSNGLVTADHSAGVYVLRFQNPSVDAGTDPGVEAKAFRDQFFNLSGFLPTGISPQFDQETTSPYFLGLSGANEAYYTYSGGGYVRIGSGVTTDGAVIIGVVFGPGALWSGDHTEGDAIFDSLIALG